MSDSTGNGRTWSDAIVGLAESFGDPARLYTWAEVDFIIRAVRLAGYRARVVERHRPDRLSYDAGHEAGYRQRVAEENAGHPDPAVFDHRELMALAAVQGARAAARVDRTERYSGGPVPPWDADLPEPEVTPGRLFVRPDGSWDEQRISGSMR